MECIYVPGQYRTWCGKAIAHYLLPQTTARLLQWSRSTGSLTINLQGPALEPGSNSSLSLVLDCVCGFEILSIVIDSLSHFL